MENPSEFADYIVYLGENGPSFKASPTVNFSQTGTLGAR